MFYTRLQIADAAPETHAQLGHVNAAHRAWSPRHTTGQAHQYLAGGEMDDVSPSRCQRPESSVSRHGKT